MSDRSSRAHSKRVRAIVTYSAFGVIIVGLALYLGLRRSDRIQYKMPEVPKIESASIESIRIDSEAHGVVELQHQGDNWLIAPEGYKPDDTKIKDMVNAIQDFTLTELVSTAGYYERYELDPAHSLTVTVRTNDDQQFIFEVGKRAPTYNHTYVRLSGDDRIFQARGNLQGAFGQDAEALRDKVVFTIDPEKVAQIGVTTPDGSFRLYKSVKDDKTTWTSSDEVVWDTDKIKSALDRLSPLSCQKYLDDQDFGQPSLVLDVQGESSAQLFIFGKTDSNYAARSSQVPYPFEISSYQAEQLISAFQRNDS